MCSSLHFWIRGCLKQKLLQGDCSGKSVWELCLPWFAIHNCWTKWTRPCHTASGDSDYSNIFVVTLWWLAKNATIVLLSLLKCGELFDRLLYQSQFRKNYGSNENVDLPEETEEWSRAEKHHNELFGSLNAIHLCLEFVRNVPARSSGKVLNCKAIGVAPSARKVLNWKVIGVARL